MLTIAYRTGYRKIDSDNPQKGSYGLKIPISDRDKYFKKEWNYILLKLEGRDKLFNVDISKKSFWNISCHELIHKNIKYWFQKNSIIPWEKGNPPKIELLNIKDNQFEAKLP